MNIPNKRSSCFCFRVLCLTLSAGAILTACSSPTTSTGAVTNPLSNTRKSSLSAGSWKTLFDGKSADAWRGYGKQTLPEGWQVKEGTLALVGKGAGDILKPKKDLLPCKTTATQSGFATFGSENFNP